MSVISCNAIISTSKESIISLTYVLVKSFLGYHSIFHVTISKVSSVPLKFNEELNNPLSGLNIKSDFSEHDKNNNNNNIVFIFSIINMV